MIGKYDHGIVVELGSGDILIAHCRAQGSTKDTGILFTENPNGKQSVGTEYPELRGEKVTCISPISVTVYFKSVKDINLLIADLEQLKKNYPAQEDES